MTEKNRVCFCGGYNCQLMCRRWLRFAVLYWLLSQLDNVEFSEAETKRKYNVALIAYIAKPCILFELQCERWKNETDLRSEIQSPIHSLLVLRGTFSSDTTRPTSIIACLDFTNLSCSREDPNKASRPKSEQFSVFLKPSWPGQTEYSVLSWMSYNSVSCTTVNSGSDYVGQLSSLQESASWDAWRYFHYGSECSETSFGSEHLLMTA